VIEIKIKFLGGCDGIGKSAILVDGKIMMDYGLQTGGDDPFPLMNDCNHLLISHGHLDHCGSAPLLRKAKDVFATAPTADFTKLLLDDSVRLNEKENKKRHMYSTYDIDLLMSKLKTVSYNEEFKVDGYSCTFLDAGHIVGSSSILLKGDVSLFYSSDINSIETKLIRGSNGFPGADVGIVESTYFGEDHTPRKDLEDRFIKSIKETIEEGGNVIIPCFAINRTQEILSILGEHNISPYLDGMGVEATKIILSHPSFIKNSSLLKRSFDNVSLVNKKVRKRIFDEPSVIVTTAGMANGGPVLNYLKRIYKDPKSKLMFTGYQVEGTNGRMILEKGLLRLNRNLVKIESTVEQYDFSSHSGDKELKSMVKRMADKGVNLFFTVHGDRDNNESFVEYIKEEVGCEAIAPHTKDTYNVSIT